MKPYYFITLLSLLSLGFISPSFDEMQLQSTQECYPYGTPDTTNSGVVCPYVEAPTEEQPTDTMTVAPTYTPTPPAVTMTNTPTSTPTLTITPIAGEWFVGDEIGIIPDDIGRQGNTIIFINSYTGDGMAQFPNNQYGWVDLTGKIPPDTKGVFVSGILIITHGSISETCDLQVWFRRDETVEEWSYIGQSVEAHVGGGQRQPMFELLPVKDSKMQFKWYGSTVTSGNWPDHCAYGVNFRLAGYVR